MQTYHSRRFSLELQDEEIESLSEILRLAHERLRTSPCIQMHGCPLERQAGLVGPQLFRVKLMLEQIGRSVGEDLPYDDTSSAYPVAVR